MKDLMFPSTTRIKELYLNLNQNNKKTDAQRFLQALSHMSPKCRTKGIRVPRAPDCLYFTILYQLHHSPHLLQQSECVACSKN